MRVLVADDNLSHAELLHVALEQKGHAVQTASCGSQAMDLLGSQPFDALILELNLPEMDGFEILQRVRNIAPELKTILMSGALGVDETVRAMKLGAVHCFAKPVPFQKVVEAVEKLEPATASGSVVDDDGELVVASEPMREMNLTLRNIARSKSCTVLITGETGSGKEVVARRLHRLSDRRDKPFIAVNCSAIPASLIESELFGHERGAFTDARLTRKGYFESAADGCIFLDEIGDLSLELQAKLLRVVQERNFRRVGGSQELPLLARVIAATNIDLAAAVRRGRFREDLYYRLAVIPVHLLPLRQRRADILPLARKFLQHFSRELDCEPIALTEEVQRRLLSYAWPGNVRELRNVVERFVLLNGSLEFVPAGRDLESDGMPVSEAQSEPIQDAERQRIYDFLLRRLMGSEKAAPAESLLKI